LDKNLAQLLPGNLQRELKTIEKSQLIREITGWHDLEKFLANKQKEIENYLRKAPEKYYQQVSQDENKTYPPTP
jgi:glutamine synthetase